MYLQPSPSRKYYVDVHTDNTVIFDANVDLGYEDNVFDVLGGSIDDYVSVVCFRGYNPPLTLIAYA